MKKLEIFRPRLHPEADHWLAVSVMDGPEVIVFSIALSVKELRDFIAETLDIHPHLDPRKEFKHVDTLAVDQASC
jgi:hypothetical protein